MAEFRYEEPFPTAKEEIPWRRVASDFVSVEQFDGQEVLKVAPQALTLVAREAFRDVAFLYRPAHLAQLAAILADPEASENDRGVALALLRNAEVAAGFVLPMCQDTGTATIIGKKGQRSDGRARQSTSRGVSRPTPGRTSATANRAHDVRRGEPGTNLPAQVDAGDGRDGTTS
jgi:fumarate hydratase class I